MNTFRALCLAAVLGLMVTSAFPQGRGRGNDEKGGQSSGGQTKGNDNRGSGGSSNSGGQSRGNDRRETGGSQGGPSRGGDSRGSGGGSVGGGSQGGPSRGGGDSRGSGGGSQGVPVRTGGGSSGGGSQGGPGRGGNDDSRTGGSQGVPVKSGGGTTGGGSQGGPGRGGNNDSRGGGGTTGGGSQGGPGRGGNNDSRSGGSGNTTGGSQGGPTRGGNNDTRGNSGGSQGGPIRGGNNSGGSVGGPGRGGSGGPAGVTGGTIIRDGRFNDQTLTKKDSRSGTVRYGNSNNVATITKVGTVTVIGPPPRDLKSIRHQIIRKDNPRLIYNGVRYGYYFYDPRWCDDYFWYPHYTFDPWSYQCAVSPWYYYPMLPAYVRWDRCRFYSLNPWNVWLGINYQWSRPVYYGNYDVWGRRGTEIDYAVDDIVNAFERGDRRAAGRLIPERSEVAIYIDGNYSYTLGAEDSYDMFMDATQNTKTTRYSIDRVERGRDNYRDTVRVTARHEYEDPWGMRNVVTHYYELRYEGRNLVISKFGVSGGN